MLLTIKEGLGSVFFFLLVKARTIAIASLVSLCFFCFFRCTKLETKHTHKHTHRLKEILSPRTKDGLCTIASAARRLLFFLFPSPSLWACLFTSFTSSSSSFTSSYWWPPSLNWKQQFCYCPVHPGATLAPMTHGRQGRALFEGDCGQCTLPPPPTLTPSLQDRWDRPKFYLSLSLSFSPLAWFISPCVCGDASLNTHTHFLDSPSTGRWPFNCSNLAARSLMRICCVHGGNEWRMWRVSSQKQKTLQMREFFSWNCAAAVSSDAKVLPTPTHWKNSTLAPTHTYGRTAGSSRSSLVPCVCVLE